MDQLDSSTSDRADAAVAEYLRRVDCGEIVVREQFITAHDNVAVELKSFFAAEELLRCFVRLCALESADCN